MADLNLSEEAETRSHDLLFQLNNVGDKLKRTLNAMPDERVLFEPDEWQRNLLDIVDKRESAIICCPTSSGKTFISYYAMEQSLRANNSDVVVFVSPNKALANQVNAEIYARFGYKTYPTNSPTKSVFAIYMPDYVVGNHQTCQILITVPSSFEDLLSQNDEQWQKRIKYIIIDEIQSLNSSEMSLPIQKIVHFAQCPILALSATIGNLGPFVEWMSQISESKGIKTHLIIHKERFCDLKKHLFVPSKLWYYIIIIIFI